MVVSHGAPDLYQEIGIFYCGHLEALELLLFYLLLELRFSGVGKGLDRFGPSIVNEHKLLMRVVNRHTELGAHVGLKEYHGAADEPKYIIRDSLYYLQPAGSHVVLITILNLAQKLSTGGYKVTDDVNKVDRCVDGHQPFLHDELRGVKLLYCLAKATNGVDQNEGGQHLHDQQAKDEQFFLHMV